MALKKIYFVANARMPNKKAYAIQIAKMCEAFVELGYDLTLILPFSYTGESLKEFYGLRVEIPVTKILSFTPPFWKHVSFYKKKTFALMTGSYIISYFIFFLWKKIKGEDFVIYSLDMDPYSYSFLPLFKKKVICEFHSPKPNSYHAKYFFNSKNVKTVATIQLIADELHRVFGINSMIEPNGVDLEYPQLTKEEARVKLGLQEGKIAMYVGRFYKWKGLEVLPPASKVLSGQGIKTIVLGGTKEEFKQVVGDAGDIEFYEAKPADVHVWMQAADVLLLTGTNKNVDSQKFTSPMKVFEYLGAQRPVVASKTDALESFVPNGAVIYTTPDNPAELASAVQGVVANPENFKHYVEEGYVLAQSHTWAKRAQRISKLF